jgi:hypothetical protein
LNVYPFLGEGEASCDGSRDGVNLCNQRLACRWVSLQNRDKHGQFLGARGNLILRIVLSTQRMNANPGMPRLRSKYRAKPVG